MRVNYARPSLQPDEFIEGYAIRLAMFTGAPISPTINNLFYKHAEILAENYSNPKDFYSRHTLTPIYWAMSTFDCRPDYSKYTPARGLSSRLLKACPTCRKHDIETLGFHYFRTKHQLKGIFVCVDHGDRLREFSIRDFSVWLDNSHEGEIYEPSLEESPLTQTFLKVATDILTGRRETSISNEAAEHYRNLIGASVREGENIFRKLHEVFDDPQSENLLATLDSNPAGRLRNIIVRTTYAKFPINLLYCFFLHCHQLTAKQPVVGRINFPCEIQTANSQTLGQRHVPPCATSPHHKLAFHA
jgi:hypothetical protein